MKTAFVTGANKGIGHEIARELAAHGFHVFLGARKAEAGQKAADEMSADAAISRATGKVTFVQIDVADSASVKAAAATIAHEIRALDVLVNNAGIVLDDDNSALTNSEEIFRQTFETNTLGPLRVTQALAPLLRKSNEPRVINISSGAGQLDGGADGWAPAYCISKTALNGVTAQLAHALPEAAVNSVCPGWVRTDMGGSAAPRSVQEGADTPVWLATEAPHSLTGQFIKNRAVIPW